MKMFKQLIVLGLRSGTIYRVDIPHGRVDTLYDKAGPEPDGVVVENGIVYWTTMGTPTPDPSADDGFDFSARDGGLHSVWLDGSGARDVIPTGAVTTGKQLVSDGAGTLYWGDGRQPHRHRGAVNSLPGPRFCDTSKRRRDDH
jgi:hypothetical protein